ncbi:MAG TPA: AMP-binding protein [Verrucomicrobiae bacterium]|jgi:acyl-CoA synthetase (AMP-forming)/AMP-acid ligase II|nr:AMP-binding protein [Verrucomicrobiae bacterium]
MANFLLIGDALKRNAYKYSVKPAIRDGARVVTYGELNGRVNRLANGLLAAGFRKGAAAALLVGNRIEHLEILFALAKIGVVAIPLDVKWRALEIGSTLSSLEPAAVFLEEACRAEFAAAQKEHRLDGIRPFVVGEKSFEALLEDSSSDEPEVNVIEDDPFVVMITSGTTGFPKGCITSHRTYVFHCINNAIEKGLGAHDVALLSSPIYFSHGRSFTIATLYFGGTVIIHSHFDPVEVLKTVEREKVTYLGTVPTMCERLLQAPDVESYDLTSIRCLSITGGKVHPPVLEKLRQTITPNIYRTYAATDSGQMAISKPADMAAKPASAGRPVWCAELRIVDEAGRPVAVGDVGEILSKSPLATQGYYKNPAATEASFRDGWFHTGDLGYFDEDGYLYVVGRKKDMVKSGGISIYPLEIETVLYHHPDVLEAAVIGLPDPEWGEIVKAVVVPRPGTGLRGDELIQFCKERLASYKVPKAVEIVDALPHTELGKVAKERLKQMLSAGK